MTEEKKLYWIQFEILDPDLAMEFGVDPDIFEFVMLTKREAKLLKLSLSGAETRGQIRAERGTAVIDLEVEYGITDLDRFLKMYDGVIPDLRKIGKRWIAEG